MNSQFLDNRKVNLGDGNISMEIENKNIRCSTRSISQVLHIKICFGLQFALIGRIALFSVKLFFIFQMNLNCG